MEHVFSSSNAFLVSVIYLSIRLGAVLLITPLLGVLGLPSRFKLLLILALSVVLIYGIPTWQSPIDPDINSLIVSSSYELVLGLVLSLGVSIAFAAVSIGARLIDTQIGYGIAQVFDPLTHRQLPIVTGAINQFSVLFFFILDFHHTLLRGIAMSIDIFPLGKPWPFTQSFPLILKHFAGLITLGFSLVAPIVFCILIVEFVLAVLTRNLPQLHMFTFGIPIKIVIGLFALATWFIGANALLRKLYSSIFDSWRLLFQYG